MNCIVGVVFIYDVWSADDLYSSMDEINIWVIEYDGTTNGKVVGVIFIVGVQECDIHPACLHNAGIATESGATI